MVFLCPHLIKTVLNHLNLPYKVTVTVKGTITYIYDAAGNKLEKMTDDATAGKTTRTDYLSAFVYENDTLQFFGQEEGRIRMNHLATDPVLYKYDYFVKDHLGNTRAVLTDEQHINVYPAVTLETADIANDSMYYNIVTGNIANQPAGISPTNNYYHNNGFTNPGHSDSSSYSLKMYKIDGSQTNNKTGLGITLKVMAGDKIEIFGKSYYFENTVTNNTSYNVPATQIIDGLLGKPGNPVLSSHSGISSSDVDGIAGSSITGFLSDAGREPGSSTLARAYINYIIFDDHMAFVSSGFESVGTSGSVKDYTSASALHDIAIPKNGYIYVYCSNESPINVYFDNLQVVHTPGPLLEETHYYPFGLTMAGISSKAAGKLENRYKYGGNELQHSEFSGGSGLELYDFNARQYDQQIGRFHSIDPMTSGREWITPYNYVQNNPIIRVDPMGTFDWIKNDKTGDYTWDNNVTSAANTPKGSTYVGANDKDIVKDLGYPTESKTVSATNRGVIHTDFEEGDPVKHIATYGAAQPIKATVSITTEVNADVTTTVDANMNVSKTFNGLREDITMKMTNGATEVSFFNGKGNPFYLGSQAASPNGNISESGSTVLTGAVTMTATQAKQGTMFPSLNTSSTFFKPVAEGKAYIMPSAFTRPIQLNVVAPLQFSQFVPPIIPKR